MRMLMLLLTTSCVGLVGAQPTYDAWLKHRDALVKDPSLVRYYTFEQGTGDATTSAPSPAPPPTSAASATSWISTRKRWRRFCEAGVQERGSVGV